jgi:hypothetical protein
VLKKDAMTRIGLLLTVIGAALVGTLPVQPALAQNRVFVSALGSDSNPCSIGQPCRTFQHAHDVVAAGGEINVLDPAGYSAINITKSVNIEGHGYAGITAPSGNAVTINAEAFDDVSLRGVILEGVNAGNTGILFNSGRSLSVSESVVNAFQSTGIRFSPSILSNPASALFVSNVRVSNSTTGVAVTNALQSGYGTMTGILEHVQVVNQANGQGPGVVVGVSPGFSGPGYSVTIRVTISESVIANHTSGIAADGATAIMRVTRSTITGNDIGWSATNGAVLMSFGDNSLAGNTVDGAPTSTISMK